MNTPLDFQSPDLARRAALLATLGALASFSGCAREAAVPTFDYTLLDGTRHHSAALRGQVLMLNFWATSCAVCVKEMPQLAATHRQFAAQGLQTWPWPCSTTPRRWWPISPRSASCPSAW